MQTSVLAVSSEFAAAAEQAGRAVVAVHARRRLASSGILWRPGVIVTAAHTLERREEITVTLPSGQSAAATLAGGDPGTDIAALRIQDAGTGAAATSDAAALKVGNPVVAVGRSDKYGASASFGFVSAVGGPWRTWRGGQIDQFLRPDLEFYPGFSGGALADIEGRIVGMNTSGLSRLTDLTIPAKTVERVLEQLLAKGRIVRGYLGVGLHPVRLPRGPGLVVVMVEPGAPAEQAGVLVGDILVAVGGTPVTDSRDLQTLLGPEQVGQAVELSILRGGAATTLAVTPSERPQRGR